MSGQQCFETHETACVVEHIFMVELAEETSVFGRNLEVNPRSNLIGIEMRSRALLEPAHS